MSGNEPHYFIGLMSGTSLDAIDAVLVDFSETAPKLIEQIQNPLPEDLRANILALCEPGPNEIQRAGKLDSRLGELLAGSAIQLLNKAQIDNREVVAIGSHGQTIRHCPEENPPFTLQIGDPNVIAQRTRITTIADFRRRDVAAGGQGAPFAPAFHQAFFSTNRDRVILNIGGIANLTYLPGTPSAPILGFDTGPGNVLIDAWCQSQNHGPYDAGGEWAATGFPIEPLLEQLLTEPYFQLAHPKSTGRELFNLEWLQQHLKSFDANYRANDVCATLVELTAITICQSIELNFFDCKELFICGGGAHNQSLLKRIASHLPDTRVNTTQAIGIDPDWVEAIGFAWLAKQTLERTPVKLRSVTGASQDCVLGGVYYT